MKSSIGLRMRVWLGILLAGGFSSLLSIQGAQTLVPAGSVWKYLDNGSDQAISWISPGFDDNSWPSGPAQLGFGDGDEATVIGFGSDPTAKIITTYFRRTFELTNSGNITSLTVRLLRDDGGIVYLNGVEVFRSNMPPGPVNYQTLAVSAVGGPDEMTTFYEGFVLPNLLVTGSNVLAVEVHQNAVTSSDLSFDLALVANDSGVTNPPPVPPTIVTQPQSLTVFAGENATFSVEATGTAPLSYRWRRNGIPLPGATGTSLTLFNVQPTNAGNYSVIVSNLAGSRISSNAVLQVLTNTNQPLTVTLTSPTNGAVFAAPATILLRASTSAPTGSVAFVEFFAGTNRISQDFTSPYTAILSNTPPGNYQLTAVATVVDGTIVVSAPVNITVTGGGNTGALTLISTGAVWRYFAEGIDLGTAWRGLGFDDSAWSSGPAQLGYGDGDEATVVGFGPDPANKYITTYFRRTFGVTNTANVTSLTVRLLRDDGGIVYLNGMEIFRSNMPGGPINFSSLAVIATDDSIFYEGQVPPNLLLAGPNIVAVEIHQNSPASSDMSFDLALVANATGSTNPPPVGPTIVSQPQSQTVFAGQIVTFSVSATGTLPLNYQWRFNGVPIQGATTSVLALNNVQPTNSGNYSVSVSNAGGITISSNAFLQVLTNTNQPFTVTLISPTNGARFVQPASIFLRAITSLPTNLPVLVEFFAGTNRIGQDSTSPYFAVWSNAPLGNFQITAVATDPAGVFAVSAPANITVVSGSTNPPPLSVALTSPTNGSTFVAPASIVLNATASGGVGRVEFYSGTNRIGQDFTAPYSALWSNVPPGNYQLTALAVGSNGTTAASLPVNIAVTDGGNPGPLTLIPAGAVWKYLDNGTDQGTAWVSPAFDDSAWAAGAAQLGYGDGDEATVVSFGPDAGAKYITTYFRRTFGVTNTGNITGLTVRLLRDDGGVVYLNGVEVFRSNMPEDPVTFDTLALLSAEESIFYEAQISPDLLVPGPNVVAVEIHQNAPPSSDISFDLELVAQRSSVNNRIPPTILTQPQSQTVAAGSTVSFNVVATGTPPLIYRWRRDGVNVAVTTNAFLTLFNVQPAQAGHYSVIVTNIAGFALSSNALLTVIGPSNRPPVAVAAVAPRTVLFPDQEGTLVLSLNNSNAMAVLNGSLSSDPDNDLLTYAWAAADGVILAMGATVTNNFDLGNYTVVLIVDDAQHSSMDSVTFEVITAGEAVQVIIERVQASGLPVSVRRPILATLRSAQLDFEAGEFALGVRRLHAFQMKVQMRLEPTDPALANLLINAAQAIVGRF